MKTLREVQKCFESLGVSRKPELFNQIILRAFVIFFSSTISQWIFLLHEADNSRTYMESAYLIISYYNTYISFASIAFNKEMFFALIDDIDHVISESKLLKLE